MDEQINWNWNWSCISWLVKWVPVHQYDTLLSTAFMKENVSSNCTIGQLQTSLHSLKLGRLLGEVGENYAIQNMLQFDCACRLNVRRLLC